MKTEGNKVAKVSVTARKNHEASRPTNTERKRGKHAKTQKLICAYKTGKITKES